MAAVSTQHTGSSWFERRKITLVFNKDPQSSDAIDLSAKQATDTKVLTLKKEFDLGYSNVIIDFSEWFIFTLMKGSSGLGTAVNIIDRLAMWILLGNPDASIVATLHKVVKDIKSFSKFVALVFKSPSEFSKAVVDVVQNVQKKATAFFQAKSADEKAVGRKELQDLEFTVVKGSSKIVGAAYDLVDRLEGALKLIARIGAEIPAFVMHPVSIAGSFLCLGSATISCAVKTAKFASNAFAASGKARAVVKCNETRNKEGTSSDIRKIEFAQLSLQERTAVADLNHNEKHRIKLMWQIIEKVSYIAFATLCIIAVFAPAVVIPGYVIPLTLTVAFVVGVFQKYAKERGSKPWKEIKKIHQENLPKANESGLASQEGSTSSSASGSSSSTPSGSVIGDAS